ncbi:MAG: N-acetyltransferase [Hymenobacteraceae bacterium]|nr:N-acetyltransferase [Hymenobacteraceae bacterium]MDX5397919.1 N-acetyltransferase [Hymenobacteraceae bacterium]MDX5513990.1 N-acetyltransferase [Hymenobacteraceae bacterium]
MHIRPYQAADQEEVLAVWLSASCSGHNFIPAAYWKSQVPIIRDDYLATAETWVAIEKGKIAGFISLLGNLVGGLFVLPAEQGKGIGSALVKHAAALRKQPLTVEVYEKNIRARRFYQKYGFTLQGARLHDDTNETLLLMQQLS